MQAIILAGGKGTRLRPYTTILPKPLMPVGESPILEILLMQLKKYGVKEIILSVGYLKSLIQAYFQNGEKHGLTIRYSNEDRILGTAGPLSLIENLSDNFLVINGDVLSDIDFQSFYDYHINSGAVASIATFEKVIKIDLGVLELEDSIIVDYHEKPDIKYTVSTGIYCFNKEIIEFIKKSIQYDMPTLIKDLIDAGAKINSFPINGAWYDIGTPSDYEMVNQLVEDGKLLNW